MIGGVACAERMTTLRDASTPDVTEAAGERKYAEAGRAALKQTGAST
jgi:hypothetical protein